MEGAGKSVITGDAAGELLLEIRYDARMRAGNRMTPASTGQPLLLYRVAKSDRNLGSVSYTHLTLPTIYSV